MGIDKRDNLRHFAVTEVSYEHMGLQFQGRISDLSQGGFFIDSINPLPDGSLISFRLSLPGDESEIPITGEGRVAWKRPMQGMGISFTRLSDADQDRLKTFLFRK
jgi:uncharacterized protein (TIGR02266 family)